MKVRVIALICCIALLVTIGTGCSKAVSDIADSVVQAAKAELENQIKNTLEEYKVEFVEIKTAVGKLNDEGGKLQLFCAVLVKSESDIMPNAVTKAISGMFQEVGVIEQTTQRIESTRLTRKELSYDFTDFSDGNTYYTIYCYAGEFVSQIPTITLPATSNSQ